MNSNHFYAFSAFFNGLFALFVVYYVYLRNRKNPVNRSFLFYGISVAGWTLLYTFWVCAKNASEALFYVTIQMMFEAFIPATFLHFTFCFTHPGNLRIRKWLWGVYGSSAFYSVMMPTSAMIAGTKEMADFNYWPTPGWLMPSHTIFFSVLVLWSHILLFRKIFRTHGMERQQATLVFGAFLIGFGGGSVNWLPWYGIDVAPTTHFFVGIMFATMAYAIVKYGVMDVDMLIEMVRNSRASMLGIMASSLSHELRNPLFIARGTIETHLDTVRRKNYPSETEALQQSLAVHETVLTQLNRSADIVQRFLSLARPRQVRRVKSQISLKEAVYRVLGFVEKEITAKNIRLRIEVSEDICIAGYEQEIDEILLNLIVNGFQAMRDSGGELRVSGEKTQKEVILKIQDHGEGIPEEDQRKIFEPFFSTKGNKGTGLGLYITQQLVERNGGRISVQSKSGKGTIFILEFKR